MPSTRQELYTLPQTHGIYGKSAYIDDYLVRITTFCTHPCLEVQGNASLHVGGCQNYDPFLGTLNTRCRIIIGTQKGLMTLTTTRISSAKLSIQFFASVPSLWAKCMRYVLGLAPTQQQFDNIYIRVVYIYIYSP